MKNKFTRISSYIIAAFLLLAGIAHFRSPETFEPLFFDFVSKEIRMALIYISGVAEIILALGLLTPKFRSQAAMLTFLMLVLYIPLHVRDVLIDEPVVGSQTAAVIRLLLQFGLLYWVWLIGKKTKSLA